MHSEEFRAYVKAKHKGKQRRHAKLALYFSSRMDKPVSVYSIKVWASKNHQAVRPDVAAAIRAGEI
jgi:hypothetical protein